MKLKMPHKIFPIIFICTFIFSCEQIKNIWQKEKKSTEDAQEKIEVYVFKPKKEKLFTPIIFAGIINSQHEYPIYAALGGVVKKFYKSEGDSISQRTPLLTLAPDSLGMEYKTHIQKATANGTLVQWNIKEGQHVLKDQKLGLIADLKNFETTVKATYSDLPYLKIGNKVDIIISPSTKWQTNVKGVIKGLTQQADSKTQTFSVHIKILCPEKSLCSKHIRIGSLAEVELRIKNRMGYLVPSKYIRKRSTHVLIVDDENKSRWVPVEKGEIFGEATEIIDGISETTKIISTYTRKPDEGDEVSIIEKETSQK